jgi:hypothetical protein
MQKGLFGIESEQEKKAKEGRQLEHSVKTLLANYQKKIYQSQLFKDLYHYAKEKFETTIPASAYPYPNDATIIQGWLGQIQERLTVISENVLDLNQVWKPTKTNIKTLLRGNRRLKEQLEAIAHLFWGIKSRLKFKTDSQCRIYPNDAPSVQDIVARIEELTEGQGGV